MSEVHHFDDCLARSHEAEDAPWWEIVYRRAFPGVLSMVSVRKDGWAQRGGIDRILTLNSGKTISIDEKVRSNDWPDILIERWSDRARRKPGWIQKPLACDFIAYAFTTRQRCYLLQTIALQTAWRRCGRDWVAHAESDQHGFRVVLAQNPTYVTESIAVPIPVLLAAIQSAMIVDWGNTEALSNG